MRGTMYESNGMRTFVRFLLVAAFAMVGTAQAQEKAVVVFKNESSFRTLFLEKNRSISSFQDLQGFDRNSKSLSQVEGKIEDVLEHVSALIVDVRSISELAKLQNHPDVLFVEKEVFHPLPPPMGSFTLRSMIQQPWGIAAVNAPQAWEASGYGEGVRVLVLDTGIDRDHPALKNNFEDGRDFVGGKNDFPYPYFDNQGHGTHVAGTIAAELLPWGFSGVAPKAKILAGRVCGNLGCPNTSIVRGINWAIEEKVDVVNMSLGGRFATSSEKLAVAKADTEGVVIVAASGNDGTGVVSYPAALPTVIAVGAVDVTKTKTSFSQYGPELDVVAPGASVLSSVPVGSGRDSKVQISFGVEKILVKSSGFAGAKDAETPIHGDLVPAGLGKPDDFKKSDFKGKLALIQRGELTFVDKVKNALNAGASGVILYNNAPGLVQGSLTTDGSVLPVHVVMIEKEMGEQILAELLNDQVVSAEIETIKTDYSQFDGTSMATPHVAGVVALIRATNKNLNPAQVKDVLTSTASPLGPNSKNEYGAGLVQADAAVQKALLH